MEALLRARRDLQWVPLPAPGPERPLERPQCRPVRFIIFLPPDTTDDSQPPPCPRATRRRDSRLLAACLLCRTRTIRFRLDRRSASTLWVTVPATRAETRTFPQPPPHRAPLIRVLHILLCCIRVCISLATRTACPAAASTRHLQVIAAAAGLPATGEACLAPPGHLR